MRVTVTEKSPLPSAVPDAGASPPVISISAFGSAVPTTTSSSAFFVASRFVIVGALGATLSISKETVTALPAPSVTISVYVLLSVTVVPEVNGAPFKVAVAPVASSEKVIVLSSFVSSPSVTPTTTGSVVSTVIVYGVSSSSVVLSASSIILTFAL